MQEALWENFDSGSTATVVLIADGQIISANVGDSKAFLCSEGHDPHHQNQNSYVSFFYCPSSLLWIHISMIPIWIMNYIRYDYLFIAVHDIMSKHGENRAGPYF
jgi:hypothetical protein